MESSERHDEWIKALEKFYVDLSEVAKKHGYLLDHFRAEAPPCDMNGKPLPLHELLRIYGDLPEDWHWRYKAFLENNENLKKVLRLLISKGYRILLSFTAQDAMLGNVVVEVEGKWFAIGECRREFAMALHARFEDAEIEVTRLWTPFYVLANIKKMEVIIQDEISVERLF